jgi:hypothetical protein
LQEVIHVLGAAAGEAQVAQGLVVDRKAAQVEPNSGLMLAMVPAAAPS